MAEDGSLAQRFEEHWIRLKAMAYRMLGSLSEADDAVKERDRAPAGSLTAMAGAKGVAPRLTLLRRAST